MRELVIIGSLSNNDGDGYEKRSEVALLQTLSRLFHLVQFVKFFLELNSKRLYRSSGKEK